MCDWYWIESIILFNEIWPQIASRSGNRDLTYEDNDVAAEKELIHTSALSKLQKQNNLILK